MDSYTDKLNSTNQHYPFDNWRIHYQQELIRQWEPGVEDTNAVQTIFDQLLAKLIKIGEEAFEKEKTKQIIKAIESTNDCAGLIMNE